jgi:RNA polymerase sigma-70 factor (ECF subfamily)
MAGKDATIMDETTFSDKMLVLAKPFYRMAKSILLDEEWAKDSVQDLYLKLWEKRKTLHKIENPAAFALKTLRNLCLDKLRKKKEIDAISEEWKTTNINILTEIEQKDMVKFIKQLINQLPELQRTIIRLRDVEGFEIKEIAYITSTTENAVMVNLSRARQKIRERLTKM